MKKYNSFVCMSSLLTPTLSTLSTLRVTQLEWVPLKLHPHMANFDAYFDVAGPKNVPARVQKI